MCGIFVKYSFGCQNISDAECQHLLHHGLSSLSHRGPDNKAYFKSDTVFLGHTRLSIIGLNDNANQPIRYEDLVMIFNGEVYNYLELADELKQLGYTFSADSDSEVLLKGYHAYGRDVFGKLNGMWSLVIYNEKERQILISRDRFGQKPLFYILKDDSIYFSSEIQSLYPFSKKKPDLRTIQKFLFEGGYEHENDTFFSDIKIFPKSHFATIDKSGNCKWQRYWDYPEVNPQYEKYHELIFKKFNALLDNAVSLRLRSDVPVGLLLSGGVDSTIIADIISRSNKLKGVACYTYSSGDTDDEAIYATAVSSSLNFDINLSYQDNNAEDYVKQLRKTVSHMGRGHSSPAVVSVGYLYQRASKDNLKVILDGQGADELLAGYKSYHLPLMFELLFRFRFKQFFLVAKDYTKRKNFFPSTVIFIRNTLPFWCKPFFRRCYGFGEYFNLSFRVSKSGRHLFQPKKKKATKSFFSNYLKKQHDQGLENLLYYSDIVAMQSSVENRSPFMDYRLVDLSFQCGFFLKVYDGLNKAVLKKSDSYQRHASLLERTKVGFSSDVKLQTKEKILEMMMLRPLPFAELMSNKFYMLMKSKKILEKKHERVFFRIFQVYLWFDIFQCEDVR